MYSLIGFAITKYVTPIWFGVEVGRCLENKEPSLVIIIRKNWLQLNITFTFFSLGLRDKKKCLPYSK